MLKEYLESLSSLRKLTREEEARLWEAYKRENNRTARERLIEQYQLLVCKEAMTYSVQETVLLDLIQEGTVGLMEAVESFDPSFGVAFSLYAIHRIRGRMVNFLKKERKDILLPEKEEQDVFLQSVLPDVAFERADREEMSAVVKAAMERLPAREQDVLSCVYLGERTVAETAAAMSVSSAYVYQLEKRGIRRLRGMLSHWMHDRK